MAGGVPAGTMPTFANSPGNAMLPPELLRPVPLLLIVLGAILLIVTGPADAAETARRLQVELEVRRDGAVRQGADQGRGKLVQQLTLTAVLHSDGTPMPNNPLDPEDSKRQFERAQRSQQKVQAAQARVGAAPAAAPDMSAMQARARQLMAKCGNQDRECLMREASALSAAQAPGADAATQGRLQAYGQAAAACERQQGKAREACQADARRKAGGGEEEPDDVVETPYLMFTGRANCRLEAKIRIDERVEGSFNDVQGVVPYTETTEAQQTRREDVYCPMLQVVLDQRNGRLWTHVMLIDSASGAHVRSEKGRAPQRSEGPMSLRWMEAGPWIEQRHDEPERRRRRPRVRRARLAARPRRRCAGASSRSDRRPAGRVHGPPAARPGYSGMLPCLRQGLSSFLPASITSERQIRRRVSCGWITSSM